jgi:hypothetical protein
MRCPYATPEETVDVLVLAVTLLYDEQNVETVGAQFWLNLEQLGAA